MNIGLKAFGILGATCVLSAMLTGLRGIILFLLLTSCISLPVLMCKE